MTASVFVHLALTAMQVVHGVRDTLGTGTSDRLTDPNHFRGGHAENQIIDNEACEFKKTHHEPALFQAEADFLSAASKSPVWSPLVPALLRLERIGEREFMVLRNVMCGTKRPVVADFKLGLQSWTPDFGGITHASMKKRTKMDVLDSSTTTKTLGVRATSIQIPPSPDRWGADGSIPDDAAYLHAGRKALKFGKLEEAGSEWRAGATREDLERLVEAYLPTPLLRKEFVEKLQPLIEVFKVQDTYRFTGASLLVYYDGEHALTAPNLSMILIDFPHTLGDETHKFGRIDEGVLTGLYSLDVIARRFGLM